jgi:hypothetical protein
VAEDRLQGPQIDAGFQHVGGEAVPQRVRCDPLAQAQAGDEILAHPLHGRTVQRPLRILTGEEPPLRPVVLPVDPQHLQEPGRQRHEPILAALPLPDRDHHADAVDVRHLQADQFADPQPAGVSGLQEHPVPTARGGVQEAEHLLGAEHDRQRLRLLPERDHLHEFGSAERGPVEESHRAGGLVVQAPRHAAADQVELVEADLLGPERVGRAAEVPGEPDEAAHVRVDGPG